MIDNELDKITPVTPGDDDAAKSIENKPAKVGMSGKDKIFSGLKK